jgi:hypothetical protein
VSDRYQREIEELLRKMDTRSIHEPLPRRLSRRTAGLRSGDQHLLRGFLRRAPVEQFMVASIFLVLGSFVFGLLGSLVESSIVSSLARWSSLLGILFFVLAIVMSVAGGKRASGSADEPRWRGQVVDFRPRHQDLWTRLRAWFRRR